MIYLYVKTHNITGLKYLGKTIRNDYHEYTGSGDDWIKHLETYGYDYTTKILLATENNEELKETGLFFSKIFNVVKSKEWANLIDESGSGGITSTSLYKTEKHKSNISKNNWAYKDPDAFFIHAKRAGSLAWSKTPKELRKPLSKEHKLNISKLMKK